MSTMDDFITVALPVVIPVKDIEDISIIPSPVPGQNYVHMTIKSNVINMVAKDEQMEQEFISFVKDVLRKSKVSVIRGGNKSVVSNKKDKSIFKVIDGGLNDEDKGTTT